MPEHQWLPHRLYREFRVIWIILLHIETVGPGLDMFQDSSKDPCAMCLLGVSTKSSFRVACFSWVLKRCNLTSGTLKPDPIFRGKRCTWLTRPVDNLFQRSQGEGRRLRWCHPSATLGTDYPWVAAVNLMPSNWTSFCWVVRGRRWTIAFFQTRVILQGWCRFFSVRNVMKTVKLTHLYYKKCCFYFPMK